jgi:hypothetical protein
MRIRYRIPGMAGRGVNIAARVVFFLGGVVSLAVAALYAMLRGSDLPRQSEWVIFTVVLGMVGAVNVLAAIFPAAWTARVCRVQDKSSLFSLPLRMFGGFAVVAYLVTVGFFFTPHAWNLSGYLWTYLLCPVYIVRETFDPPPVGIFLMLGVIEAAVYGAVGSVLVFASGTVGRSNHCRAGSEPL